ncbi:MAG: Na+/H+ antiporter subunit C [Alphaproteobacteria bacterium]
MELALAVLVGVLTSCAIYLILSGNMVRFIFALALLSNAVNLAIFAAGRLTYAAPPLIDEGAAVPDGAVANALPQALILTAIVIGFGLLAFTLVLVHRAHQALGTVEADGMRVAEPAGEGETEPGGRR